MTVNRQWKLARRTVGDIEQGLENAPQVVKKLFADGNTGKLLVQIGPEP